MVISRHHDRITSMEIARMAGVGVGTVSRVLNHAPNVSRAMRERVTKIIDATGYRPCSAARMLSRSHYGTIGLVSEIEVGDTFYGLSLQSSMSQSLTQEDLRLALAFLPIDAVAAELARLPILRTHSVDGVVLDLHRFAGDLVATAAQLRLPYVLVNPSGEHKCNAIVPDDQGVAAQATAHLLQRGHRRIAYLPTDAGVTHSSQPKRLQGYLGAMAQAGLVPLPWAADPLPAADFETGIRERVERWTRDHGCTAIVIYNSVCTAMVVRCCYELAMPVPAVLSLISCDYEPTLDQLPVPVTHLKLDRRQMGEAAVEMILARMQQPGRDLPSQIAHGELHELSSVRTLRGKSETGRAGPEHPAAELAAGQVAAG